MASEDIDLNDALTQAAGDYADELEAVAAMTPPEQHYLGHAEEIDDPLTDGLECDSDTFRDNIEEAVTADLDWGK